MLSLKAARGTGLHWGLAEDVARSARWLAQYPIPWAESLLALLESEGDAAASGQENGASAALTSAVRLGSFLSDSASECWVGKFQSFRAVAHPIWVLPPLINVAHTLGLFADVRITGVDITIDPSCTLQATASPQVLCAVPLAELRVEFSITPIPSCGDPFPRPLSRASAPKWAWEQLERLAFRTYVPASMESRIKGAGAGVRDDD
jgi:hypothetical protein